jgi:RNA polymerase sigma-70 factor (ECF subfamily)
LETDEALVAEALAGGPEAFAPIIERYKDAVFGVALAKVRNFHDAEDIAQTVFVEAFQTLKNLREAGRLGPWLRTIAINRSINHLNRKPLVVDLDEMHGLRDPGPTPHVEMENRELRDRVLAEIGRLSKAQRETTTLFYIDGFTQEQVASLQEIPVGTVKRRLHDARNRLKKGMMEMVEEVLKDSAPKGDFADRVFELLNAYPNRRNLWKSEISVAIQKIGSAGEEGFARAMGIPHWKTRRAAAAYLDDVPPTDTAVALLKRALSDSNRKVRKYAMHGLMRKIDVPDERRRKEFLPLIIPLLRDPSRQVRLNAIWTVRRWAGDVPGDVLVEALLEETCPRARGGFEILARAALESRREERVTEPKAE